MAVLWLAMYFWQAAELITYIVCECDPRNSYWSALHLMGQYYTETIKSVFRRNQNQSRSIRNHHEAPGRFKKDLTRQGDQPQLREQTLQWEQTRQRDQAGLGDQPRIWGQALQNEQAGQGYQAEQGHQPWLGSGPSRESRLGRESRLSRETSLWWEDELCIGIPYSNRCIYHFNPTY